MSDRACKLDGIAIVLGASSGFGAAAARQLARAGCDIVGVHLDLRATRARAERVKADIEAEGRRAWFFNANAADPARVEKILDQLDEQAALQRPSDPRVPAPVRVLLHSLAFGTLLPYIPASAEQKVVDHRQLTMTTDVMAHSLVLWVQKLVQRGWLGQDSRVFAMTSPGGFSVWKGYGAVSAAKAALEAHIRQLAVELAPLGATANALCAGVTRTPALERIPEHERMAEIAERKNPHHRLTVPEDVANAIVALARPETYWVNGNVIRVDGGEAVAG